MVFTLKNVLGILVKKKCFLIPPRKEIEKGINKIIVKRSHLLPSYL